MKSGVLRLVIMGAGGLGPEIVWAASNINAKQPTFDILGYCDDDAAKAGTRIGDYAILGTPEKLQGEPPHFLCGIGHNETRARVVARLVALGWRPATVIDPSVHVAPGVSVGPGTYVGAGSILSPNARIGDHVIINHHCSIGHDSTVGSFAQASPGVRVSGFVRVEEGAMLGSNAVVAPGRRVGRFATVGAASFALRDVPDGTTVVGTPAREIVRHA